MANYRASSLLGRRTFFLTAAGVVAGAGVRSQASPSATGAFGIPLTGRTRATGAQADSWGN